MRTFVVLAAGATALLGACAQTPEPPPPPVNLAQQNWILIAPPDHVAAVAFLETFEYLPDHKARFPGHTNGLAEQDRASLEHLFERVAAEATPEERLEVLTEVAVMSDAPVEQWRKVRVFRTAEVCRSTREQLLHVIDVQTKKFGAYSRMPREEFQWPLLGESFQLSHCVPEEGEEVAAS